MSLLVRLKSGGPMFYVYRYGDAWLANPMQYRPGDGWRVFQRGEFTIEKEG